MKTQLILVGFAICSLCFLSCESTSKEVKPDDFVNDFIESEITLLNENKFSISKEVTVDGNTEKKELKPNWEEELAFLNEYANDFRKNGKIINPDSVIQGDTLKQLFNKSANKSLLILSVNDKIIEFTIQENRNSLFSARSFFLNYKSQQSYRLKDNSEAIWIMKNDVAIQSSFLAP